jgi:hypothetical protein
MAERSIGMTSGSGDGDAGGYNSSRMTTFFDSVHGSGILAYGSMFTLTGSGTATLTVAQGVAMVAGFFYENTSSLNLTITGVANGTYPLVVRVNNAATALTVIRAEGTGASTTTIAAYSTRIALVSSYNSATDIRLATVTVTGGTWAYSNVNRDFAVTRQMNQQITASANAYSNSSVANGTAALVGLNSSFPAGTLTSTNSNVLKAEVVGGIPRITIYEEGHYLAVAQVAWDTNTTGSRFMGLTISNTGSSVQTPLIQSVTAASVVNAMVSSYALQSATWTFQATIGGSSVGGAYVQLGVAQNSGAARAINDSWFQVTRL